MAEFCFLEALKSVLGSSKTHYYNTILKLIEEFSKQSALSKGSQTYKAKL